MFDLSTLSFKKKTSWISQALSNLYKIWKFQSATWTLCFTKKDRCWGWYTNWDTCSTSRNVCRALRSGLTVVHSIWVTGELGWVLQQLLSSFGVMNMCVLCSDFELPPNSESQLRRSWDTAMLLVFDLNNFRFDKIGQGFHYFHESSRLVVFSLIARLPEPKTGFSKSKEIFLNAMNWGRSDVSFAFLYSIAHFCESLQHDSWG